MMCALPPLSYHLSSRYPSLSIRYTHPCYAHHRLDSIYGGFSLDDVVIFIAVCHKELGKLVESAAITEMIIKRDESHFQGLLNYADIAGRMGKHKDAVGILMRCIVMQQENEEVKRLLGQEVGREEGVENVKR